jgi:hypothetical protein
MKILVPILALGLLLAACSDSSQGRLLALPDGTFTETELHAVIASLVESPALSALLCSEYRGLSDTEVGELAKANYAQEDGAGHIRDVEDVSDLDYRRAGMIMREECERAQ